MRGLCRTAQANGEGLNNKFFFTRLQNPLLNSDHHYCIMQNGELKEKRHENI